MSGPGNLDISSVPPRHAFPVSRYAFPTVCLAFPTNHPACQLLRAIWIYPQYRHKGYGTNSFTLALKYIFDNYPYPEIAAGCFEDNLYSRRMLKKLGFIHYPDGDVVFPLRHISAFALCAMPATKAHNCCRPGS